MDLSHLHITFQTILAFFGAVAIIGGGIKLILEATTPFKNLIKRQDSMDKKLDNDNRRFQDLEKEFKEMKELLNANNKLLIQLTEHILSGNNLEKLKEKRDDLITCVLKK